MKLIAIDRQPVRAQVQSRTVALQQKLASAWVVALWMFGWRVIQPFVIGVIGVIVG